MDIKDFIKELERSPRLRVEFFYHPEEVAKKFNITLTQEQLKKLALARELEKDPLIKATMCPSSSGYHLDYELESMMLRKEEKLTSFRHSS
jgi:hypothetical protein